MIYLCPNAEGFGVAYPICLKAHSAPGTCSACGRTRLAFGIVGMAAPSLIADRTEYVRDQVRTEASRLASVLGDDSRVVVQLRAHADELGEIAIMQRSA